MTGAGFASPEIMEFGTHEGEPEITYWRQSLGVGQGGQIHHGVFPHAEMPADSGAWCMSDLFIRSTVGPDAGDVYALGCTRLREHDGQHVAHDRPGYPVAAWIVRLSQGSEVRDTP